MVNCLDCHDAGQAENDVAVCSECGAAACRGHLAVRARAVNRVGVMGRLEPVDRPARTVRCRTCDPADGAVVTGPARRARSAR